MIDALLRKGVQVPHPASVYIGAEVRMDAIEAGVILHAGSRIEGARTSIGAGSVIGREGPAVVIDCQLGRKVQLGSGFFESSVFLDGASMGGNAHVRPGCLIEEEASGAHAVGLKQTVLLPYVTLGSLINFCDCLMAGGTSRKNHSEVGSSYIHFNYTPRQDKATASLIGDVARGVLLDQPPIFLGGQGGLVGPVRIAFGSMVQAGQVVRRDILSPEQTARAGMAPGTSREFDPRVYGAIRRVVTNNLAYIGNIKALRAWYREVRAPFMRSDAALHACHEGALRVLELILAERIKRLDDVAQKIPRSISLLEKSLSDPATAEALGQQRAWLAAWPAMKEKLERDDDRDDPGGISSRAAAEASAAGGRDVSFLAWVQSLDATTRARVTDWMTAIVQKATLLWNI